MLGWALLPLPLGSGMPGRRLGLPEKKRKAVGPEGSSCEEMEPPTQQESQQRQHSCPPPALLQDGFDPGAPPSLPNRGSMLLGVPRRNKL